MSYKLKVRKYIEYKFNFQWRWNLLLIKCFTAILPLNFLYSCVDDDFSLGKEYLKGNTRIVYVDTCTAVIKTVSEDSTITSGLGYALVGEVNDSIFGKIKTVSYMPFKLPSVSRQDYYKFDSANFTIRYLTEYYGDTTQIQSYSLYRLTKEFSETADNYRYFSSQNVPMNTANPIIPNINLKPGHGAKKTYKLRLDALGKELLTKFMKEEDQDVADDKSFANSFSGLALVPRGNNNLISSFSAKNDSDICIKIFYHYFATEKDRDNNVDKESASITISLNKDRLFNQVTVDRKGTHLESLNGKKHELYCDSSTTNNQIYIQGLTGLSMEVEFPYLKDLKLLGQNAGILGLYLILKPEKGSYSKEYPLADSLSYDILNKADDNWGSGSIPIYKDDINYGINTDYGVDITRFFKDQLTAYGVDQKRLVIKNKVNASNGFLRRVVLSNDQKKLNDKLKIEIKLIIYAD